MKTDLIITETEAAVLLKMTPEGVAYVHESGRLELAQRINGRRCYRLADVQALAALRAQLPARGRPSAHALLARRKLAGIA